MGSASGRIREDVQTSRVGRMGGLSGIFTGRPADFVCVQPHRQEPGLDGQCRWLRSQTDHVPRTRGNLSTMVARWTADRVFVSSGRELGYLRRSGGRFRFHAVDLGPFPEEMPSWSRDGRWIYFRSDRTGIGQLWKTRLDGRGAPTRVTTGAASQGFESPDGRLLYFVRSDNAPGLWSVPVGGGPETFVLPDVQQNFWAVADDGIAFVAPSSTVSPKASIRLFSFASRKVSTLAVLRITNALSGFSITRDSQSALWPQPDTSLNDLMLIDPWKP